SRRRHTRLVSDWSSDVCSSDLWELASPTVVAACAGARNAARDAQAELTRGASVALGRSPDGRPVPVPGPHDAPTVLVAVPHDIRSEERRVGRGCRSGGWPGR